MVTIKCSPWHVDGKALLLGDAAHAIVPFFGQGMNCAFEDCTYFLELLDRYGSDWPALFSAFEKSRKADTDAIADLAIENFVEMRDRVADPRFLFRKKVELELEKKYPGRFVPKYAMVTFHRTPYSVAAQRGADSGPHARRALRFGAAAGGHRLDEGRSAGAAEADSAGRSVDGERSLSTHPPASPPRWMRAIHWPRSGSNSIFRPGRTAAHRSTSADIRSDFSRSVHAQYIEQELEDWATLGVEAHFHGRHPWMPYHRLLTDNMAGIVGAKPVEVVVMNSLTVNLHLMMVSFYRPTPQRHKIVVEAGAFPSDQYAV